jgi:hypothetical protein
MKKNLTLLFACISVLTHAQNKSEDSIESRKIHPEFQCRHLELRKNEKQFILKEDVKIDWNNFYAESDSAIYDKQSEVITMFSPSRIIFKGEVVIADKPKNILRYRKNDKIVYID